MVVLKFQGAQMSTETEHILQNAMRLKLKNTVFTVLIKHKSIGRKIGYFKPGYLSTTNGISI